MANRKIIAGVLVFLVVLSGIIGFILLTGHVDIHYGDTAFTVEASYYRDLTLPYAAIEALEYREDCPAGARIGGFGSVRLALGNFRSDALGHYTRYGYAACRAAVVLRTDGETIVLTGADEAQTRAIYAALSARKDQ